MLDWQKLEFVPVFPLAHLREQIRMNTVAIVMQHYLKRLDRTVARVSQTNMMECNC